MRENCSLCAELVSAVFFFGHNQKTMLEAEKFSPFKTGMTEFILGEVKEGKIDALNMPPISYDFIYRCGLLLSVVVL